jgi:chromosome partitioning protein
MGKVVSFINMKGGVGKTTLAVNIAYTLSKESHKKVLLIDTDPQMNATQHILNMDLERLQDILNNPDKTIYGILSKNFKFPTVTNASSESQKNPEKTNFDEVLEVNDRFHLIPSHLNIMSLKLIESPHLLGHYIEKNFKNKYDVIILDLPPTISAYTKISLLASNAYVVPMKTDYLSFFGFPLLQSYVHSLIEEFGIHLDFVGIILNMTRDDQKIYKDVKEKISKKWEKALFKNELKYRIDIAKALSPEECENIPPYIIERKDEDLKLQIKNIAIEFAQRLRL